MMAMMGSAVCSVNLSTKLKRLLVSILFSKTKTETERKVAFAQVYRGLENQSLVEPVINQREPSCACRCLGLYCDLDGKCPLKAHVLRAWSPAGGALERWLNWEDSNSINGLTQWWVQVEWEVGIIRGSMLLGHASEGCILSLTQFFSVSASWLPGGSSLAAFDPVSQNILPHFGPQNNEAGWLCTENS